MMILMGFMLSVAYHGNAQEMVSYFASVGHVCPKNYNPAEFAIDLVSTDFSSKEQGQISHERVQGLVQAHRIKSPTPRLPPKLPATRSLASSRLSKRCGWLEQFSLLLKRSWRQTSKHHMHKTRSSTPVTLLTEP